MNIDTKVEDNDLGFNEFLNKEKLLKQDSDFQDFQTLYQFKKFKSEKIPLPFPYNEWKPFFSNEILLISYLVRHKKYVRKQKENLA